MVNPFLIFVTILISALSSYYLIFGEDIFDKIIGLIIFVAVPILIIMICIEIIVE